MNTDQDTVKECVELVVKLPAYSTVQRRLEQMTEGMRVCSLWQEVFGENVWNGARSLWDLEWGFAHRVNDELFPIDLRAMQDIYANYEEPVYEVPIPVIGFRVPWEVATGEECDAYMAVVCDCLNAVHTDGDQPLGPYGPDESDDELLYVDWLAGSFESAQPVLARLAALEPPLNGLADVVRLAIQPTTGNPFLDFPPDHNWASMEYAYAVWYWTPEQVCELAEKFNQVREVAERIQTFAKWFDSQDQEVAKRRVLELLMEAGEQTEWVDEAHDALEELTRRRAMVWQDWVEDGEDD